ncbi:NADPH-dependent aldehyde reductase 1, chloroplastic-like [Mercurialis annua]|uniref:NADPH-dependent aldehyde reductase 1, chloroplastic-like n=1 Tax=Mercurialis annua TaxID=3986 RepID=UPI00215F8305|nr:NADPH-dependent aldehyde reductase 1, chloroplastic-like [Mercurialis annua]
MATERGYRFPAQSQDTQPGKEYLMHPLPQFINPHYNPSNKLQGKVALVTGGDSGIGRAVSYLFTIEGATVAFTYVKGQEDKDKDHILNILKEVKPEGAKDPIAIHTDVGFEENCEKVVDRVISEYGKIDILVNNAAEQYSSPTIQDITQHRLERVFRTNIFSHFYMSRYALQHMKEGSCIINTTSVAAYSGNAEMLDYSSTKGAIVSFTRSLALNLVARGIRVNAVAPGPVWTPLQPASMSAEKIAQFGSGTPMDRAGQPFEIAPSFVFLASHDCSSYITGQVVHPNGGMIVNA